MIDLRAGVLSCTLLALLCNPSFAAENELTADLSPVGPVTGGHAGLAPADENFGAYPMSVMGIETEIRTAGARFRDASERAELEHGAFAYSIDAIRDLERRFPHDPEVQRGLLAVARVFMRVHNQSARELASHVVHWLEHDYPSSTAAHTARAEYGAPD